VFFVMASVGLPGLNGFVGEFLTLLGAFTSPASVLGVEFAAAAAFGMILAAIYLLYMVGRVVFGPLKVPAHEHEAHGDGGRHGVSDLNVREILTLAPLAVGCIVLGLAPYPVLRSLEAPIAHVVAPARQAVLVQQQESRQLVEMADEVKIHEQTPRASTREPSGHQPVRRSALDDRQSAIGNWQ
ncbi:MAG: hypothetical protein ACODAQ_09540, partial [Phycisphaeraceae bacterium]